ncbi:MAG: DEAD/DEAH box helicase, partial [Actinobacteria bacterium]|nr:DEAD/DEAH box helicase [Actinomycetota bacterium]
MSEPITLRDLQAIDVAVLKGIGDKRKSSLSDYGVENVLDLLTTYPRRWVDRTNEARVADLQAGQEALVIVEIRTVPERIDRTSALRGIHLPESILAKEESRRRLAFDELLRVQTVLVGRKRAFERNSRSIRHVVDGELLSRFVAALPFPLTGAQRRVIEEISHDLAGAHPMHRLLQGDVGSGKTVVAVAAMLVAVQGKHQGALMAPTEVLAEQHYAGVTKMVEGLQVPDPDNLFGDRP